MNTPRVVKRIRGRKLPPNTVYVGRGSRWGNPFKVKPHGPWSPREACIAYYRWLMAQLETNHQEMCLRQLEGKNVACWCVDWEWGGNGRPYCHAVELLILANNLDGQGYGCCRERERPVPSKE